MNLGSLGWMISFVTSFVVYYAICLVWPTKNQKIVKQQRLRWEQASLDDAGVLDASALYATSAQSHTIGSQEKAIKASTP